MHPLRLLVRVLFVLYCLAWHGLRFWVAWMGLLAQRAGRDARRERFAAGLLALFRDLGATFIKLGQIMSTRPDLLPPHVIRALARLQDDVGPFPYDTVRATLRAELGREPEAVFVELSSAPIASASVAQVHKAQLGDGRVVAVKVRRPHVEEICALDLSIMRLVAHLVAIPRSLRLLAPVESVDEFARGIRTQLDFRIEAANNRRFRANFAGDPDVMFPALVDELCSEQVLVMEFVAGVKVLDAPAAGHDGTRLAQVGFRTLLSMVFAHGFVHADLHPGNILVRSDGRVVLLDLGLCAELDELHRGILPQYLPACARTDGRT